MASYQSSDTSSLTAPLRSDEVLVYDMASSDLKTDLATPIYPSIPPISTFTCRPFSWILLQPNSLNSISPTGVVMNCPLDILTSEFQNAFGFSNKFRYVFYFPRSEEYSATSNVKRIIPFTSKRIPGIHLGNLLRRREVIDGGGIPLGPYFAVRPFQVQIDWPGLPLNPQRIQVSESAGRTISRAEFAYQIALRVFRYLLQEPHKESVPLGPVCRGFASEGKRWNLSLIPLEAIHLMGLIYSEDKEVWVPVIAFDPRAKAFSQQLPVLD